jgi:hypothetical protein
MRKAAMERDEKAEKLLIVNQKRMKDEAIAKEKKMKELKE